VNEVPRTRPLWAGLAASLLLPSLALANTAGAAFVPVYLAGGGLLLWLLMRPFERATRRLGERTAAWTILALLCLTLLAVVVVHPRIDTTGAELFGVRVGASDNDDAVDVGTARLLAGENPYRARTFLGNPIAPLPGAFLLALPFYALGHSAVQNVFWLAVFAALLWRLGRRARVALILLLSVLLVSPDVVYQLLQGGDYATDALATAAFAALVVDLARRASPSWQIALAAAGLGIAVTTRANLLLVVPLVVAVVWRAHGADVQESAGAGRPPATALRAAVLTAAVAAATVCALVLPFYFWDPAHFTPLLTREKASFESFGPLGGWLVPVAGVAVTAALCRAGRSRDVRSLFRDAALVQMTLVLGGFALSSLELGEPHWFYLHYGLMFLFFGVAAWGVPLLREDK
jgi:hypothetical protein